MKIEDLFTSVPLPTKEIAAFTDNTVTIQSTCTCGDSVMIDISIQQYEEWVKKLRNIQDIFPELSLNQRERLQSGYCPQCWSKIFPPDPGEED